MTIHDPGKIHASFRASDYQNGAPLAEPADLPPPPGAPQPKFEPLASRDELLVSAWLKRELPPRDYLSGEVVCTTSRILLVGETGVGKTLFSLDWAGAMAAGADFLGWQGRRRCRVMYFDGELPAETFKERIAIIAERYGEDIELFGYNRDVLGPDEMPPLNTDAGRAWLWREIETVKPDALFLDAIMCLLAGNMSEEESWAPVKDLVRQISSRRIAQVWLHHTGHDASKGYGTKTREWEMDTVIMLSKLESEDDAPDAAAFRLEFTKARMKKPTNFAQFAPQIVRATETGFVCESAAKGNSKPKSEVAIVRKAFIEAYEQLANGVEKSAGFDGATVQKVGVDAIRDELKNRGFLDVDDKGRISAGSRQLFRRAKSELLAKSGFVEAANLVWRTSQPGRPT